ncbi:EAL domain-containing protein [Bacillus sp. PS06]|uniref:EAL domain-containing protein n=1 Tax=Bacillus sp. PS06 TaxID=2764176 RepID=UPI00178038E1|nr:EAL domain-containing protein [Bacillus sp. PS06]MBD8067391.1 EAL domain-containing protein [Bacillus sp. PS06]
MNDNEKINILIVDDRPENLLALEVIIEREDYNIIKAFSGEEALKYLLKYDFAAILLDVQMPGIDGFGTAKIIKAREKTKNIPILFITANNMDSDHIYMGYSVGAIDYIMKPFNPIILKTKVDGFVELYKMKQLLIQQSEALIQKNREIEYMAYHDSLTGLANRRLFNDELNKQITIAKMSNKPLGVLYLDMDRFKYINDSLGHVIGDKLLQEVARRLELNIREKGLVARVGGDEFIIMLPDMDREMALDVAEKLLVSFKTPFLIDNFELFVTTCIGLSVFPYDGEDTVTIIKNADAALYRAKEQGKNKYKVFHSGMNIQSYRTFILQNDLRKAISRNELTLVYQPRVEVETGIVTSAEALIRWNHPSWGQILPLEFISLAEETGQIVEIGEWVLKTVCEQINSWKEKGLIPIRIALNYSSQQFLQKNLIEHIEQEIATTGVDSRWLEIEITESVILGNEDIITQTLTQLKKMGITISLDDFGTGYSSLNYLRRFPVNTIKIDKSFIRDLSQQSDSRAIIGAIVALASNLKMSVIAEGVETKEQLDIISDYKCHEFQGFLFSQPVGALEFEVFLANQLENKAPRKETKARFIDSQVLTPIGKDLKGEILEAAIHHTKALYSISQREFDVFKLIISGLSNKEISEQLFISEHTVKNHITRILQKLNVTDRVQAMAMVYEICIKEGETLIIN